MNFAFSRDCALTGKWDELAAYLYERALALERAGARSHPLCVKHIAPRYRRVYQQSKYSLLTHRRSHRRAILAAGLKRVALLGSKTTMASDHLTGRYTDRFEIDIVVPEFDEQDVLDRIIFEELCRGEFTPSSKDVYLGSVDKLRARGANRVILGCTEIPLLITQLDRPDLPMFDTAGLHVPTVGIQPRLRKT